MVCGCCERFGIYGFGLCLPCLLKFNRFRLDNETAATLRAVFYYQGEVRRQILRSKIHHDKRSTKLLTQMFVRSDFVRRGSLEVDYVMPAPSSLWSRVHGRMDLAYSLAKAVSSLSGRPLLAPPFELGWHWRKQAHKRDRFIATSRPKPISSTARILLIDDIKTSGNTIRHLQEYIGGDDRFSVATLARSPN